MGPWSPTAGGTEQPTRGSAMRRSVLLPLICALGLATAVALLAAAETLGGVRSGPLGTGTDTEAAVRRFYAAANETILSGDVTAFEVAVGPDFVDHAPPPGVAPSRAGLERYLLSLHATSPRAEMVVRDVVAAGDRALSWVEVRDAGRGEFLGMPLAAEGPLWGIVDAWRVADGRVVERWGSTERIALLEPLGRVPLDARLPERPVVELERLEIPPGGDLEAWRPAEARLVYVEAGKLTVEIAPDSEGTALLAPAPAEGSKAPPPGVGAGAVETLGAGEFLALPPLTAYVLRNDGAVPAVALATAVSRAGAATHAAGSCGFADSDGSVQCLAGSAGSSGPSDRAETAPAVAVWPLAGGRTTALPPGPLAAAVGRATLAPGAGLPVDMKAAAVLVYVEAGTLGLRTDLGRSWVRRGGTGVGREVESGTLGAGDGILLRLGTAASLRNVGDEPLVVVVVNISPVGGPAAP